MGQSMRQLVDSMAAQQKAAQKQAVSPAAQTVSEHMQDPVGATQEGFENLTNAKLAYDMQKEKMARQLLPVQSVINHVNKVHGLQPNPNDIEPGFSPDGTAQEGMEGPETGPGVNPNQAQTPGAVNMNRPSQAGFQPGVAPGQQKQVVPGKKGTPTAGGNGADPGNPSAKQYNPTAAKPKGAGKMPANPKKAGAKPGKGNPAGSGHQIKISVNSAVDHGIKPRVPTLLSQVSAANLNTEPGNLENVKSKKSGRCL